MSSLHYDIACPLHIRAYPNFRAWSSKPVPCGPTLLPAHISSNTNTFSSSHTHPQLVSKPDLCLISLKLPSNESKKKNKTHSEGVQIWQNIDNNLWTKVKGMHLLDTNFATLLLCQSLSCALWAIACQVPLSMVSPGKTATASCHSLLQGIFPTQESNPGLLHCRKFLYLLSHPGSPSIGGHFKNLIVGENKGAKGIDFTKKWP